MSCRRGHEGETCRELSMGGVNCTMSAAPPVGDGAPDSKTSTSPASLSKTEAAALALPECFTGKAEALSSRELDCSMSVVAVSNPASPVFKQPPKSLLPTGLPSGIKSGIARCDTEALAKSLPSTGLPLSVKSIVCKRDALATAPCAVHSAMTLR
eukprot:scaffold142705_cov27-Tisochrysis_lutea.AAC.2